MPAVRRIKRPKLQTTPRREFDASLCSKVDAALKAARSCAQHVVPLETCLQDEMRILERLYYKGVNQHHMALFWRRVEEVRRLGRRVLEAQLVALLDDLRYSFYIGEDSERNPKILRSSWSQVPDAKFLSFAYDRLRAFMDLVNVAKERSAKAFHSLSLMMQTGAFLQSILVLTAIVSRLNAIMEELYISLDTFSSVLCDLLEALGHRQSRKLGASGLTSQSVRKERHLANPKGIPADDDVGEDVGSAVLRDTTVETTVSSNAVVNAASSEESIPIFWKQSGQVLPVDQQQQDAASSSIVSTAKTTDETIFRTEPCKQATGSSQPARVKKKKKKQKDEIDEIFGFL